MAALAPNTDSTARQRGHSAMVSELFDGWGWIDMISRGGNVLDLGTCGMDAARGDACEKSYRGFVDMHPLGRVEERAMSC